MKRLLLVLTVMLFSVAVKADMTFKIATLSPDGSFWMEKMRQGAAEIEAKTNNRVSFKFYPGGVMGDDSSVLKKMRFNQLNGAAVTNSGLSSVLPDIQLYNLILKFQSLKEVDYVRQKMDQHLIDGLDKQGIVSLGFVDLGFTYLMSTNPIRSLADMKNQKAWAPENNKIVITAEKAFSVSPIPLPMRDVLMGLQTGMLDVVAIAPVGALALQWHTKVKYLTNEPLSYVFGVFAVNKKDFMQLSAEDQSVVREIMAKALGEISQRSREDNEKASQALQSQGIQFIEPTPDAAAELRNLMQGVETELINNGDLSADLVKELNQHLADFRGH